ncbi:MAG: type II secretion system protein [Candidatus Eisenbacteria sp.]|nr:type II secretion system protein [Candidatus Eisenbacteria bacterium]
MRHCLSSQSGFTLVELLIVVIILGVLAAIAIPQFGSNTEDAKLSSLDTTISELRNAIEMYYHQHKCVYPGAKKQTDGSDVGTAGEAATAFENQLLLYSADTGVTSATKDATHKYGPYLKKALPTNPFNNLGTVVCDITTTDITSVASGGTAGWKFYIKTGRLIADDGAHDSN